MPWCIKSKALPSLRRNSQQKRKRDPLVSDHAFQSQSSRHSALLWHNEGNRLSDSAVANASKEASGHSFITGGGSCVFGAMLLFRFKGLTFRVFWNLRDLLFWVCSCLVKNACKQVSVPLWGFHCLPPVAIVVSVTSACGSLALQIASTRKLNSDTRRGKEIGCGLWWGSVLDFGYDFHNVAS